MAFLLRLPHGFVRRHLSTIERVIVAAALSAILYQLLTSLPAYPSPWEVVIVAAVFLVTLWSPAVAYFLAVIVALYPLYTLSFYLAVLFLAVAMLGQRIFIYNLGATLLVFAIPWLAQVHLAWIIPLLGGLWWGKSAGAWMAGAAALWGLLLSGMMGLSPDWILILNQPPHFEQIAGRFGPANSFETLRLLVNPIAPGATALLYHLLQVILWAMTAGLIGGLADRTWFQQHKPLGNILLAAGGASALAIVHFLLSFWLQPVQDIAWTSLISILALNALLSVLLVSVLEGLRDFVEHPLPAFALRDELARRSRQALPPSKAPASASWKSLSAARSAEETPGADSPQAETSEYPPMPVPEDLPRRDNNKKKQNDDLIKIELD